MPAKIMEPPIWVSLALPPPRDVNAERLRRIQVAKKARQMSATDASRAHRITLKAPAVLPLEDGIYEPGANSNAVGQKVSQDRPDWFPDLDAVWPKEGQWRTLPLATLSALAKGCKETNSEYNRWSIGDLFLMVFDSDKEPAFVRPDMVWDMTRAGAGYPGPEPELRYRCQGPSSPLHFVMEIGVTTFEALIMPMRTSETVAAPKERLAFDMRWFSAPWEPPAKQRRSTKVDKPQEPEVARQRVDDGERP